MFDPDMLDDEAHAVWDEFMRPNSLQEGEQFALWSFSYICMLELGRVPECVRDALDPETPRLIREYKDARIAAWRAEQRRE